jgi:hypothetical protein
MVVYSETELLGNFAESLSGGGCIVYLLDNMAITNMAIRQGAL